MIHTFYAFTISLFCFLYIFLSKYNVCNLGYKTKIKNANSAIDGKLMHN